MRTILLAAAALGLAATPAFAQAPNDAAATLRQGEAYSKAKLTPAHTPFHGTRHRSTSASRATSPNADNSADQLNAKQLHGS